MTKEFLCVWDTTLYDKFQQVVNQNFFSKTNGFTDENIEAINNLKIGELYNVPDISTSFIVVRLLDK